MMMKRISLGEDLDPLMAPSAAAVVVVANAHGTGFGVQNVGTMAFGLHPGIHDLLRRNAAPGGVLTGGSCGHAVLLEHGEALAAIRTGMGVDGSDLFGTLLCGSGQVGIAHHQRGQAVLCTLDIDQIQHFLTEVIGVRVFGVREDQHPVVAVGTALIVADTHGGGIHIQDALTGEIEVHPLVHGGVRSGHTGQIVLANGHIADAVLGKNGEVALTVGTHIRIRGRQLFGTLSSGGVVGGIAQLHAVQTGLCTGLVDELQEILLVHLVLCADAGVFFVDVRRNRHSVLCSARSQRLERRCAAKHHSQRHSSCRDLLNSTHFEFHKTSS